MARRRETELYPPIKRFLEGQGYEVKSEVGDCDVVAVRDGEEPVLVELKTSFNLPLVLQGVRRQAISDAVYLAFAASPVKTSVWRRQRRDILKLCRRLGLGLLVVRMGRDDAPSDAVVEIQLDPAPYRPRKAKWRRSMLLQEFQRRVGDPNVGGSNKRPIVTAYRQDALRCAALLRTNGPTRVAELRRTTGIENTAQMMRRDVYGWFQRTERGVYALTPKGERALETYADVIAALDA